MLARITNEWRVKRSHRWYIYNKDNSLSNISSHSLLSCSSTATSDITWSLASLIAIENWFSWPEMAVYIFLVYKIIGCDEIYQFTFTVLRLLHTLYMGFFQVLSLSFKSSIYSLLLNYMRGGEIAFVYVSRRCSCFRYLHTSSKYPQNINEMYSLSKIGILSFNCEFNTSPKDLLRPGQGIISI